MKPSGQAKFLVVRVIALATIAMGPTGSVVYAQKQQLADSIVGESLGYPVTLSSRDAYWMLELARAARVPLGFEVAPPPPRRLEQRKITATGRRLGDVLDEFVQIDSRYRWHEDDGVIAVAPESPTDVTYLLESMVGPVRFQNVDARHVLHTLARLLGQTQAGGGPADAPKFSLDFPGGTLRELLNGVVRAHGSLRWTMGHTLFAAHGPRISFGLGTGSQNGGFSIPPGTSVQRDALENTQVGPSPEQADVPILDRIVGRMTGQTVTVAAGGLPLDFLSESLKVPMGFQRLPELPLMIDPASLSPDAPPPPDPITITDRPLGEALSTFVNLDPRYSWREIDGVIAPSSI